VRRSALVPRRPRTPGGRQGAAARPVPFARDLTLRRGAGEAALRAQLRRPRPLRSPLRGGRPALRAPDCAAAQAGSGTSRPRFASPLAQFTDDGGHFSEAEIASRRG
jgi:hypothetical protein